MQFVSFDEVYELIQKARTQDIRARATRLGNEAERAKERYEEAKAKRESYERLLEDRPDNPGLKRWRGQRAREEQEALADWQRTGEKFSEFVSRHQQKIYQAEQLAEHVRQSQERAREGMPARELSDQERRSLAAHQSYLERRERQRIAQVQQVQVEEQKLANAYRDLKNDPNNPVNKRRATYYENRVRQKYDDIEDIGRKIDTSRQNVTNLVSAQYGSEQGLSRGQKAARTRAINVQTQPVEVADVPTAPKRRQQRRAEPQPEPEPQGIQLTRRIGIKSITGVVASNIESATGDIDEITAAATGKGRFSNFITSGSLDTDELKSSIMSRAIRDGRKHDKGNQFEDRIKEIANEMAEVTAEGMEKTLVDDKVFIAKLLRDKFRSGEIDAEDIPKLARQYLGLGRQEILSLERRKRELRNQGYGEGHVNREAKKYKDKLKERRADKITRDEVHRINQLTQQKIWEEQLKLPSKTVTTEQQMFDDGEYEVEQEPEIQHKKWVSAGDHLVCPECEIMDGTVIPVDKDWITETRHGTVAAPPMHPNCRCTIELTDETGDM